MVLLLLPLVIQRMHLTTMQLQLVMRQVQVRGGRLRLVIKQMPHQVKLLRSVVIP